MHVAVPFFLTVFAVLTPADGGQPVEDDPAVAAARSRQAAVKTLRVEFKRTDLYTHHGPLATAPTPANPVPWTPAGGIKLESVNRLTLDADKACYEDNHSQRKATGKVIEWGAVHRFDGTSAHSFYPFGMGGDEHPSGMVWVPPHENEEVKAFLEPVCLTVRGLNPSFCTDPIDRLKPTGNTLLIDGSHCPEYASARGGWSYWLDPGKGYVPRRCLYLWRGKRYQVDVQYGRREVCGWFPTSWVVTDNTPAVQTPSVTAVEVLDVSFNEAQPAGQFEMRFPPGCRVNDLRHHKYYRVQPEGVWQELGPRGEDMPVPDPWYWRNGWLLVRLGVLLAALIVLLAWWRKKAKVACNGPE